MIAGVHGEGGRELVTAGGPEFEAALAAFVTDSRLPGGVAGVVHADELVWSAGVGFADVAARRATEPGMAYAIASVTKTFTGTAVMQLRDAGCLDLDDPAARWLPELRRAVSPAGPVEAVQGDPARTLAQASAIVVTLAPNARHKYSDLACVGDLATWLSFQLSAYRDPPAGSPVLPAASLRAMHKPRYLADDGWTRARGISWCASRQDDAVWITHSGGVPGFTAAVCFDPRTQIGAIVLLNGTTGSAALAFELAGRARALAQAQPPMIAATT